MRTKLLAFLAGAVLSMNASAAYLQYDFSGPITGSFVVHDDDLSIATYRFHAMLEGPYPYQFTFAPFGGEGADRLTKAWTHFKTEGPTSFAIFDDFGDDRAMNFVIDFGAPVDGQYAYRATYSGKIMFYTGERYEYLPYAGTLTGHLTEGTIDPGLAAGLDYLGGYHEGVPRMVPTYVGPAQTVPEPGGIALFAAGALGAAGVLRRRSGAG